MSSDLQAAIMNVPNESDCYLNKNADWHDGFAEGHRNARHQAAELAAARAEEVQRLREALERIARRCPTDSTVYALASVGDTARLALTQPTNKEQAPAGGDCVRRIRHRVLPDGVEVVQLPPPTNKEQA